MAQRGQRVKAVVHIGNHRGGFGFVDMVPATVANGVTTWECIDPKPGRAAALARVVGERFPAVRTTAQEADGRDVPRRVAEDAVIVSTVDTVGATLDLIASRRTGQALIFQLVGRGPGLAPTRIGIGGAITEERAQAEARLLFEGLATITEDSSSRALTDPGDPVTAAILRPMRRSTTSSSVGYFANAVVGPLAIESPLSWFTPSGRFPLVVRRSSGGFRADEALAVEALDALAPRRSGVIAAVALVSLDAAIDVLFVRQSRTDRRYVDRVLPFRLSRRSAVFSD